MSQTDSKRKFLKPMEAIVSTLLALSTPLPSSAAQANMQDILTTSVTQTAIYQNDLNKRSPLLIERSNAKLSKVDYYSHSSHSSHSSHASHYSSSR